MLTDTHCHLYYEELFKDLAGVLDRAHEQGVNRFICVGTNIQDSKKSLSITDNHENIFASTGIHPHDADKNLIGKHKIIENSKYSKKIIGIGETGLDFYYSNSDKNNQIKSFINHIEACLDVNKTLIVHSRNAEKETFEILNQYKNTDIKQPSSLAQLDKVLRDQSNKIKDETLKNPGSRHSRRRCSRRCGAVGCHTTTRWLVPSRRLA